MMRVAAKARVHARTRQVLLNLSGCSLLTERFFAMSAVARVNGLNAAVQLDGAGSIVTPLVRPRQLPAALMCQRTEVPAPQARKPVDSVRSPNSGTFGPEVRARSETCHGPNDRGPSGSPSRRVGAGSRRAGRRHFGPVVRAGESPGDQQSGPSCEDGQGSAKGPSPAPACYSPFRTGSASSFWKLTRRRCAVPNPAHWRACANDAIFQRMRLRIHRMERGGPNWPSDPVKWNCGGMRLPRPIAVDPTMCSPTRCRRRRRSCRALPECAGIRSISPSVRTG